MKLSRCFLFILFAFFSSAFFMAGAPGSRGHDEALDGAQGNPDRGEITTGVLYDRVVPISRIENHDGGKTSGAATLGRWKQMYHEISQASLNEPAWPSLRALLEMVERPMAERVIPVAFMNFKYNKIRPDAFEDGSLVIRGGRLIEEKSGIYLERRVFAAAALRDYTHRAERVVFALDRRLYLTNDDAAPRKVEIDFNDGHGYRTVRFGQQYPICYTRSGLKTIGVKMSLSDDTILYGSFDFHVEHLQTPNPHDTLDITAAIPYNGEYGSGEAYIYLSDSNASLANPIVIIEGFDIDNSKNWDELYYFLNKEGLVETLRAEGYDMVVLNFTEGTDYIQKNGFVIVELIQQVLAVIDPNADIALVGASMGGLCARYALAYMETEGIGHRVRNFISFDSPMKGANIPLGVQYWMDFFSGQSESAAFMLERLDKPAARQMLVYHHTDPPGTTGESDSLRSVLLSDLASVGQYPENLRKVAIANGSGSRADQGFAAGDQIILYEYSGFLVDIIGNVWAVPDGGSNYTIFDGLIDIILLPREDMTVTVTGTLPYDNAPGGSRPSMAQMDTTEAPYGDIVALHDSHCFIPTISALDLDTEDLFYDIAGDPAVMSLTPFDTVYYPAGNQEHVDITPENANWLIEEVKRGVTAVGRDSGIFPGGPVLYQNFPNPFNPVTCITFELPRAGRVELEIFNVLGEKVNTLLNRELGAGKHTFLWDGKDARDRKAATGIYFCRLRAGDFVCTRKMILLK